MDTLALIAPTFIQLYFQHLATTNFSWDIEWNIIPSGQLLWFANSHSRPSKFHFQTFYIDPKLNIHRVVPLTLGSVVEGEQLLYVQEN